MPPARPKLQLAVLFAACCATPACGSTGEVSAPPPPAAPGATPTPVHPAITSATREPPLDAWLGRSGCGASAPPLTGPQTLTVAGKERSYLVQLPPGYDASRRYPVLFGLHGAGGSGPSYMNGFPLRALWQDRAVLVFPSALFYELDGRTTWRYPTEENLAFFDAMVRALDEGLCIDRARIFASGFSSGGFFSNTLGCRRGGVVRAIVPVAGGDRDFDDRCVGHVAVMVISSPLDSTDPTGGPAGISHHERGLQARDYFRERNGCQEASEPFGPDGCVQYQGCLPGAEVRYCEHGQGHAWPSSLHAPAADFLASY